MPRDVPKDGPADYRTELLSAYVQAASEAYDDSVDADIVGLWVYPDCIGLWVYPDGSVVGFLL